MLFLGRDRPFEPFVAWQWTIFALLTAGLSYGEGSVMYPGTGVLMGVIVAAGAAFGLLLGGIWKLYHTPRQHEAPGIVAVHLGLGFGGLVNISGVLGWIARRTP